MEMKAADDVGVGEDLTLPVEPLAVALRDAHLDSRCSSCFLSLDVPRDADPDFPACGAECPVRYCSRHCRDSDLSTHISCGECRLFRLLHSDPSLSSDDDLADLRLALRLLYALEKLGYACRGARVAGLMTNRDKFEGFEGGRLMSLARDSREEGKCSKEEAALCLVLTNAVEVQVEGFAVGVAVYGPEFSWFNHSCAPNSCYRFELTSPGKEFRRNPVPRVRAFGEESALKTWNNDQSKLNYGGLCRYGPRVVVRSIKPTRKGEQVCIAYIDLLQPKEKRRSELWSKYQFVCCCHRCCTSSLNFVDHILQADTCSTSYSCSYSSASWWVLNDYLEQAVDSYMFDGDPEACCERLETFLSRSFNYEVGREEGILSYKLNHLDSCFLSASDTSLHRSVSTKNQLDKSLVVDMVMGNSKPELSCSSPHHDLNSCCSCTNSQDGILKAEAAEGQRHKYECGCYLISENQSTMNLHPLHYVSLKAFVTLASAYRVRAESKLAFRINETSLSEAIGLSKTAAAYSLLLAGGVHYLFLSETSLIASAAQLWVSAGETLLGLIRSLKHGSESINFRPLSCSHSLYYNIKADACFYKEFEGTCKGFYDCMKRTSQFLWPCLIEGLPHLTFITDSVDFSWLERRDGCQERTCCVKENMWLHLHELVAHCLLYGAFLASVCYGFESHLIRNATELLLNLSNYY